MRKKAIFLDRDGVLIENNTHYYIWKEDQLTFVDGIFGNLRKLSGKGYLLFIVSNQGGISKGLYSKTDILALHTKLIQTFRQEQIEILEIVFCPHHPDFGECMCRKPNSLLIEKLISKHNICKEDSYFIGDNLTDMEAAQKAGIQSIKINPNCNMQPFISFLTR